MALHPRSEGSKLQHLVRQFFDKELTRRGLARELASIGLTVAATRSLLESLDAA